MRLQRTGQLVALAEQLLVDAPDVVGDVAEVAQQARIDWCEHASLEGGKRHQQGMDGSVELVDLLLERVDLLGQVLTPREDGALRVLERHLTGSLPDASRVVRAIDDHRLPEARPLAGRRSIPVEWIGWRNVVEAACGADPEDSGPGPGSAA